MFGKSLCVWIIFWSKLNDTYVCFIFINKGMKQYLIIYERICTKKLNKTHMYVYALKKLNKTHDTLMLEPALKLGKSL